MDRETTMNKRYTFSNFIMNGIGADIMIIIQCLQYCRMNNINFYMNENDTWKIANDGNWKTLFSSLEFSNDNINEIDDEFLEKVHDTTMTFYDISKVANEIFLPQKKFKSKVNFLDEYSVAHVRRGDKVKGAWKEGHYHELSEYLKYLDEPYENIFVMTDSPDVANEAKELGCMIDETEQRRDGYIYKFYKENCYTEDDIEDELKIFFKNMSIFKGANKLVGSNASFYYVLGQLLNGKKGISLSDNIHYSHTLNKHWND